MRARALTAALLTAALVVGLVTRLLNPVLLDMVAAVSSSVNNGNLPGVSRPVSPFRSGSPASSLP